MAPTLGNCSRCGKLCIPAANGLCPACVKEIDAMYEQCLKYLRENRGATIVELSEATEVSVRQITKFIREGRISLYNAPNLSYPCEVCGILIREGSMCDACRQRLARDVRGVNEQFQRAAEQSGNNSVYNIRNNKKI